MNKKINILSNWILAFAAIVFILFYLVLSFYDRPTNEDVLFIAIVKKNSLFEFINWFYFTWCGRWASCICYYFLLSITSNYNHIHYVYFLYHLLNIVILVYSLNTIIQIGFLKLLKTEISLTTSLTYSILFVAGFYFSTFQNIEVWWWICSSVDHLQGIVVFLLGVALLLKEKKSKFHFLIISLCCIYLGGSFEVNALIVGAFFLILFLYLFLIKKTTIVEWKSNYFFKRYVVIFLLFIIAASISFFSPGNFKRKAKYISDNIEQQTGSYENTEFPISVNEFLQKKYIIALGIAALWLLLGMKMDSNNTNSNAVKKLLLFSFLSFLFSIIITYSFQLLFLSYYTIPIRGWTLTSFLLFSFSCMFFLFLGFQIRSTSLLIKNFLSIILPLFVSFFLLLYLKRQYYSTHLYAKEYDKLIETLIEARQHPEIKTLYVNSLSDSGMLLPFEIGTDNMDDALKEILDLKYNIVVRN